MIIPLDVATEGYLNSPLSIATSGYLYIAVTGGDNKKSRVIKGESLDHIQRQLNEEEEIIMIVLTLVEQDLI